MKSTKVNIIIIIIVTIGKKIPPIPHLTAVQIKLKKEKMKKEYSNGPPSVSVPKKILPGRYHIYNMCMYLY
jgi:hypothetical protein